MKVRLFSIFSSVVFIILTGTNFAVFASDPPPATPDTSFSASMARFAESAAKVVPVFVDEFEKPFSPYLLNLAWLLAILCFFMMFITLLMRNEGADKEFFKWLISSVFLFCILAYAGDVNGDGKFGDVVDYFRTVGNTLAFGEINQNGAVESGSFIQTKIDAQRTAFDTAYKDFTLKSFTVKVDRNQTAVILPPTGSIEDRLFVKNSDGYNPQKVKENLNPDSWDLGSLFEWLNLSRGIMEIADLFLLVLNGFLGCALRLMFPLVVAVSLHKDLRAKISASFLWAMGVVTLIVPFFTQILRFGVYLAGNLSFQAATPTTDYYKFDSTYQTITASGNPVYMIFLMCFIMCITALLIFASPYLAFQVATGNIVNGLIGAVSGWFSGLASIGISTFTSALGGSYAYQATEQQALKTFGTQVTQADFNRQIQYEQAKGNFNSEVVGATSAFNSSNIQTTGAYNSEVLGNYGQYVQTTDNIGIDTNTQTSNIANDAAKNIAQANDDYVKNQANDQINYDGQTILNTPAVANARSAQADENINQIPVISSVANLVGLKASGLQRVGDGTGLDDSRNLYRDDLNTNSNNAVNSNVQAPNSSSSLPPGFTPPQKMTMPKMLPMQQLKPVSPVTAPVMKMSSSTGGGFAITGGKGGGLSTSQYQTAAVLNDEMMRLGYTPQARQVMLGEFGRENGFRRDVIANGHIDDANGKVNAGIISWQGNRRDKLFNYMQKQGFVTNSGRLVNSESSLRAQVRFMDNELRTGGGSWQKTHQMMTNPNFSQKDIAYRMGGKSGYIGYNNTNAKYHNAGDPIYASPNSAKWANKAGSLVAATSGTRRVSSQNYGKPMSIGGYSVSSVKPPRSVINGADKKSNPQTINSTPPPKVGSSANYVQKVVDLPNETAKALAPQYKAKYEHENRSAVNEYTRDASIGLTKQHAENSINIAQQASYQKSEVAGNYYQNQNQVAAIKANSGYSANYETYQGSMKRAEINYNTTTGTADLGFQRDVKVAEMQKEASIEAARLQAMSNLIQSVGGSVGHELGEAFEKFNRF
ncbi:MAG TPA: hypothetical protein PKY82_02290 [Pyrinomonadaceae bacterium]|nr:hypothetical protein [Pyrinomonadaceae bacterium]